jgi:hypothetical protein
MPAGLSLTCLTVIPDHALLLRQSLERDTNGIYCGGGAVNRDATVGHDRNLESRRVRAYRHRRLATPNELKAHGHRGSLICSAWLAELSS